MGNYFFKKICKEKEEYYEIIVFEASAEAAFLRMNKYSAGRCQPCPALTV